MANKLKVYQIEDTQTGEIIKIEGPEGATDEELYSFLEQQNAPAPAPEAPSRTPSVGIADANPVSAPSGGGQEVITQLQRGYTSDEQKLDPKFLGSDEEGTAFMVDMARRGASYDEVNNALRERSRAAGFVPTSEVMIGGAPAWEQYKKELEANNWVSSAPQYDTSKDFMMPENIEGVAQSDNSFVRGIQQGALEGGAYLFGDRAVDWLDMNNDKMRRFFPDATDEEIEAITDSYNAEMTRRLRSATAEQVKDDNFIVNLGGQVLGGVGVEDALPMFAARSAAGRVAVAAGMNTGVDVGYQAYDINRGVQDQFDAQRALMAPVVGAAFQGALEVPIAVANRLSGRGADTSESPRSTGAAPIRVPVARKNSKKYKEQIAGTIEDIDAEVARLTADWQNAPDVKTHQNFDKIDGIENDAIGVYLGNGRIELNAEAIVKKAKKMKVDPQDVVRAVTFHESLGHYGLARKFGDQLDDLLLNWYDDSVGQRFKARVDKWIADNPDAYAGQPDQIARAAEEVLADMSNNGQIDVTLYDRIANLVKDMLRAMGRDIKVSEREIRSILALSHATVGKKQRLAFGDLGTDPGDNGARYMYIGESESILTPDEMQDLSRAKQVQEAGSDVGPTGVTRTEYGWFQGADGKWRKEIDDSRARPYVISQADMDDIRNYAEENDLPTDDVWYSMAGRSMLDIMFDSGHDIDEAFVNRVIDHPELFERYPGLAGLKVVTDKKKYDPDGDGSTSGYFSHEDGVIYLNPSLSVKEARSTLLHELQHAVQFIEDFAYGGSSDSVLEFMPPELIKKNAKNHLKALENDAKLAQVRADQISAIWDSGSVDLLRDYYDMWAKTDEDIWMNMYLETLLQQTDELGYKRVETKPDGTRGTPESTEDFAEYVWQIFVQPRTKAGARINLMKLKDKARNAKKAAKSFALSMKSGNVGRIKKQIAKDRKARYEAYQHLYGEMESRDVERRRNMSLRERMENPPLQGEDYLDPESYIFLHPSHWPADAVRAQQETDNRYMRPSQLEGITGDGPLDEGDIFEIENANNILNSVLENYTPTQRSWPEARELARNSGLNSGHIRKAKGVVDLDKKMFQYDAVAQKMSEKLAVLGDAVLNGDLTKKGDYLHTLYKFNEVVGRIFDDQAQIARALNAMKAIQTTRRQYGELNRVLSEYENNNHLGAFADDKTFDNFVRYMQQMIQSGNTVGAATAARQVVKPYWWQYILSFRHAMMLSGLATHVKNGMDNAMMIARELEESILATPGDPIRKALRAAGAKDVQDGVSVQEVAARTYGIIRAALDSATYLDAAQAFKEGHGSTPYSAKIEMQDAYIPGIGKVNSALFAADTFFRAFHKNANLYALGVRQARADGIKGFDLFQEGSARAHDPSEDMINAAQKKTDEALLVDTPSWLMSKLEATKAIRPNMGAFEQLGAFTMNMLFPFFRVTDRLLFQAIRRSPVSFLDKNTREAFKAGGAERDIAIARTAYGTALMAYYWMAAGEEEEEKEIVGQYSKDYKKIQAMEAGGFRQNAVIEDGKYVDATALNLSFNPLDLQNNVAVNVASIREAWEKGKADGESTAAALGMASKAFLSFLGSQSYAENLSTYIAPVGARSDTEEDNAYANLAGSFGSQFVPAAARQLNQQVLDPVKRDTRGDKSFGDRVYGRIASGIPGVSESGIPALGFPGLPTKYDLYGDPIPHGRTTLGLNNYTEIKTDPVSVELQKLERTTEQPVVTGFPGHFKFEGETIKLPADAIQEWNRLQGYYLRDLMAQEIASPSWKSLSNEEKIDIVKAVKEEAYAYAKEDMLPMLGLTEGNDE